ncbi:MAG: hypothetical protein OEX81_03090 [Candidatus Pacebacteria bacterium]|nr:hypothetical protein [Candidatus Paceibacterota bacterium]
MIQKVLVTPIIGLPQINGWAQVTQSSDGQFICAFGVYGSQAGNVGRDLVDLIKSNSPDSATAVYSLMKRIVRFVSEKDCHLELSASFLTSSQTIFAAYNGSLLLKRNGKVGSILYAEDQIKVIEGKKIPEDIFVLATNSSLEFKGEIFQKLSQGLDADTTVASIVPGVQNLENSSLVAMAFLSDLPEGYSNGSKDKFSNISADEEPTIEFMDDNLDESGNISHTKELQQDKPIFEAQSGKKKIKFDKKKLISLVLLILGLFKKVLRFIYLLLLKIFKFLRQLFSNEVYVDDSSKIAKKRMRVLVLGIIVILLVSIPSLIFKLSVDAQVREATNELSPLLAEFEEIKKDVEEDPIKSREIIEGIIDNLESKEKAFSKKKFGQEYIIDHLSIVKEYYDSISGKEVFNELDVFFDFQLVESDFIASKAKLVGEIAYFLDKDKKKIITLELGNKKVEVIELGDLENIKDIAVNEENIYLLGGGVHKKSFTSEGIERVIDEGKSNKEAKYLSVFNDNVYVLNQEQRNIYKYSYDSSNSEYSDPIRWVKSAKELEFDLISSMAVDGDIWLSIKLGQIFKLSGGEGSVLEINGLSEPLSDQSYVFTKPEYNNLYILEPSSSRLIILDKEGNFIKEIKSISLASASGLVVSESLNKAIVISGSLVFEVGL